MTSSTEDLSISNFDSADRMERVLSLMDKTTPRMPLLVTTLSPALRALRVASNSLVRLRWGPRMKTHMTTRKTAINPKVLIAEPVSFGIICGAGAASRASSDCWASNRIRAKYLIIIQIEPLTIRIRGGNAILSLRLWASRARRKWRGRGAAKRTSSPRPSPPRGLWRRGRKKYDQKTRDDRGVPRN